MNYSTLEKLDVKLSKLGFGAMRLPMDKKGIINQEAVDAMIDVAMENGVNYFDTSIIYHNGYSEVSLGKALKKYKREDFFIADKMSFWAVKCYEDLDQFLEGSLERLGMDHIDFYLMHALDRSIFDKIKKYDAINWALEKQRQGKIKYLGFSIHDDADLLKEVLDSHNWDFVQIQYNYLDEKDLPGKEGYDELVKRNIPIVIMEPLKGGLLANMPEYIAEPLKKFDKSPASFSFRWLAEQSNIVTILSGMTYMEHVKDNIHTFSNNLAPLTAEEMAAIEEVKARIVSSQKVPCTGCKYCLPCPVGIQIPDIFSAWNVSSMNKTGNWVSGGDINYKQAAQCIACGKCMVKCPQHIQIPDKLKELVSTKA